MCWYLDSGTDDYYVLEADLSSTGGYVNLINISVPISKIICLGLIPNFLQTNWVILLFFVSHVCKFSSCTYTISKSTFFYRPTATWGDPAAFQYHSSYVSKVKHYHYDHHQFTARSSPVVTHHHQFTFKIFSVLHNLNLHINHHN